MILREVIQFINQLIAAENTIQFYYLTKEAVRLVLFYYFPCVTK